MTLAPRELAVKFAATKEDFVSKVSARWLLKSHDLITGPASVVMKAVDEVKDKTTVPNQMWQLDFTYLKGIGGPFSADQSAP